MKNRRLPRAVKAARAYRTRMVMSGKAVTEPTSYRPHEVCGTITHLHGDTLWCPKCGCFIR